MVVKAKFISWERIFCLQQLIRMIRVHATFTTFFVRVERGRPARKQSQMSSVSLKSFLTL